MPFTVVLTTEKEMGEAEQLLLTECKTIELLLVNRHIMKILTHAIIRRKGGGGNGYFL